MIPSQRHLFAVPEDMAYLNAAYLTPFSVAQAEAGHRSVDRKMRPWEIRTNDFVDGPERLRTLFADLFGLDADGVAIVPAASYGLATAAANLPLDSGRRVVVLRHQFSSNAIPWRDLAAARQAEFHVVERPAQGGWTEPVLAAIDERAGIVALPHCHWTDGTLLDLERIAERVRAVGARLVLDLTQSLGALPIDLDAVRPDFMMAAAYKWLFGPYTMGFLYVAPEWRDGRPLEPNAYARSFDPWTIDTVGKRYDGPMAARRFDQGEVANFALLPIAEAGLEQLRGWGVAAIQETLRARTDRMAARARDLGLLCAPDDERAGHYLGLRLPAGRPADLMARLEAADVYVSLRGETIRVTPHVYNTDADEDRFFDALAAAL